MPTISEWCECKNLPVTRCNQYRAIKGLEPIPVSNQQIHAINAAAIIADHSTKNASSATHKPLRSVPLLGDAIANTLAAVGITKDRADAVAKWLGASTCGCDGRQKRLNALQLWAERALGLSPDDAELQLNQVMTGGRR